MDCHNATARFWGLRDGRVSGGELAELEQHLVSCLACRQEWADFQAAVGALDEDLGGVEPTAGFTARIRAAIETLSWPGRRARRLFLPRQITLALGAAAFVLLTVGTVFMYRRTSEMRQVAEQPLVRQSPTLLEAERRGIAQNARRAAGEGKRARPSRQGLLPPGPSPESQVSEPARQATADLKQPDGPAPSQPPPSESALSPAPSSPEDTMPPARREPGESPPAPPRQEDGPAERPEAGGSPLSLAARAPTPQAPTPFRVMTLRTPDVAAAEMRIREWAREAGGHLLDTPSASASTRSDRLTLSLIVPVKAVAHLDALLAELGQVFGKELEAPASNEALVSLIISPRSPSSSASGE